MSITATGIARVDGDRDFREMTRIANSEEILDDSRQHRPAFLRQAVGQRDSGESTAGNVLVDEKMHEQGVLDNDDRPNTPH